MTCEQWIALCNRSYDLQSILARGGDNRCKNLRAECVVIAGLLRKHGNRQPTTEPVTIPAIVNIKENPPQP